MRARRDFRVGRCDSVTLAWTAPSPVGGSGTVGGYNVYRAPANTGTAGGTITYAKVNTALAAGLTYTDTSVAAGVGLSLLRDHGGFAGRGIGVLGGLSGNGAFKPKRTERSPHYYKVKEEPVSAWTNVGQKASACPLLFLRVLRVKNQKKTG